MKKLLLIFTFLLLGIPFSFGKGVENSNRLITTELINKNELLTTKVTYDTHFYNEDECKWTIVTTITTTSYFFLGYHVGSSVTTTTTIACL